MIVAIMPYAGPAELTDMAAECLRQFRECIPVGGPAIRVMAVANAPGRLLTDEELGCAVHIKLKTNIGFGPAVNEAIDQCEHVEGITDFLILNSDLQFPHKDWLAEMVKEVEKGLVLSPCTDRTATREAVCEGPMPLPSVRLSQVSAFCWMVPIKMVDTIMDRFGFYLFPPQFPNYGSDDSAAAVIRRIYGAKPFKLVRRAWVRHLKAKTANKLHVRAGEPKVLAELAQWKRVNKLT